MTFDKRTNLEIWGGIECTVNRVEGTYFDQLQLSGYDDNISYLESVTSLGIKKMRFPVLWEKHQPTRDTVINWNKTSAQLKLLREKNITPIAGLLHHGSGPVFTDMLQEDFPELLAAYALQVAKKFPFIKYYTPVNEPLTTARFSGLYGHWYPHKKNDAAFIRMLLNELKATVLSMQAIRTIVPDAKLVQTEDLAKTYSTPLLAYQANFENNRRWLTFDILTGNFNRKHPLWKYFMRLGIEIPLLEFFIKNPCSPDVMGLNYYVTSERFIDEDADSYPANTHGNNGIHSYADVEAVRVNTNAPQGLAVLLKEAWERYHIPISITEVHLHCTREDQVRWMRHVYNTAKEVKKSGADIIAITPWALLGSYGWNNLLTRTPFDYEMGAFDISCGYARPTGVSKLISELVKEDPSSLFLEPSNGWWNRSDRFIKEGECAYHLPEPPIGAAPLIIIGKTGTLGKAFARLCAFRNIPYINLGRDEADVTDKKMLEQMILQYKPWAIVNATGFVDVDKAEHERLLCTRINTLGCSNLATLCEKYAVKLVSFSSDLVFDGSINRPYLESDKTAPLNIYGYSKQLSEDIMTEQNPASLIVRTSAFFGPWDQYNFVTKLLGSLQRGERIFAPANMMVSPTYVPHLVNATLDLLIDDMKGIVHLAGKGGVSWYEFGKLSAAAAGLDERLVLPSTSAEGGAKRPVYSVLGSEKVAIMPSFEKGLQEYFEESEVRV